MGWFSLREINMLEEILEALHITSLKRLIDENDLPIRDRRSRKLMESALFSHYEGLPTVLNELDDDEIIGVVEYLDIPFKGRNRNRAVEAILNHYGYSIQESTASEEIDSPASQMPTSWPEEVSISGARPAQFSLPPLKQQSLPPEPLAKVASSETSPGEGANALAGLFAMVVFVIFVLPGKSLAWFAYLFPARGNVLASGRRRDNTFVHVLYSVGFWLFILYMFGSSSKR